jgi:hypothetical protein
VQQLDRDISLLPRTRRSPGGSSYVKVDHRAREYSTRK